MSNLNYKINDKNITVNIETGTLILQQHNEKWENIKSHFNIVEMLKKSNCEMKEYWEDNKLHIVNGNNKLIFDKNYNKVFYNC